MSLALADRTTLFDYQKQDVLNIERQDGRTLVALEQGLGKTIESLTYLRRNPHALPAVVVCPASVKYNWEREAAVHVGMRSAVLETTRPPTGRQLLQPHNLLICNYDILRYWVPYLQQIGIRTLIADECQNLGGKNTQRTAAATGLGLSCRHVLGLSGTPLMNRPAELYPMLHIIWPQEFNSFFSYAFEYCEPRLAPWGWTYGGAKNIQGLYQRLRRLGIIRRLKADVLHELPDKVSTVVPVELRDRAEYDYARDDFRGWLGAKDPTRLKRAVKAEAVTRMGYLLRLAGRLKYPAVAAWVDDFLDSTDEKIVVFAHHLKCVEALSRRYAGRCVTVDGGVTGRLRQAAVDQFQRDAKTRVFVGNSAALTGITLTAASNVAFAELFWRPADHTQGMDRCHRIGQRRVVFANFLVASRTIDEHLCRVIQGKQEVVRGVLDGADAGDSLPVMDQLLSLMAENPL